MARVKTLVSQTRASCANEVRRRDRQIDGLKRQLGEATRSRGSVRNPAISVISVTGDVGAEGRAGAGCTGDEGYNLRDETNEFLTELAKGLSEENEGLLAVLRRMREALRTMSGWERDAAKGDGHATDMTTNVNELEADLMAVLDHLQTILTNPSFVPLEEVVIREDEINRLREGWVKMESRWKEAVNLIDGWRRRLATSGMAVDDDELQLSLRLSPVRVKAEETAHAAGLNLSCVMEEDEEDEEEECAGVESPSPPEHQDSVDLVSAPHDDDLPESDSEATVYGGREADAEDPNVDALQQSDAVMEDPEPSVASSPLPEPPQLSPLKDSTSAGNRGATSESRSRRRTKEHVTVMEEDTRERSKGTREGSVSKRRTPSRPEASSSQSKKQKVEPAQEDMNSSVSSLDSILLDSPSKRPAQQKTKPATRQRSSAAEGRGSLPSKCVRPSPTRGEPETVPEPKPSDREPEDLPQRNGHHSYKRTTTTRSPLPRPSDPAPQQSPLTMAAIAAKLAASERDADAARVRAKLKAARMAKRRPELAPEAAAPAETREEDVDPVKKDVGHEAREAADEGEAQVKRKREKRSMAASRRRSTLSPWELESLISGAAGASQGE